MNTNDIQKYIDFYSEGRVKQRGIALYKQNRVKFLSYDADKNTIRYQVKGSKWYNVVIRNFHNNNLMEVVCSCPYDWGGICKHGVAALLHLQKNYKEVTRKKSQNNTTRPQKMIIRPPELPVEIFNAENLNKSLFNNYKTYALWNDKYDFFIEKITANKLIVKAEHFYSIVTIEIEKKQSRYFIKSNINEPKRKFPKPLLYPPEEKLLDFLIENNPDFLKKVFDKNYKKSFEKKVAEIYGIKNNFSKYFYIEPDLKTTFIAKFNDEYAGLIPKLDTNRKAFFNDFVKEISQKKQTKDLLPYIHKTRKVYVLGFVLTGKSRYNDMANIYPVKGKLKTNSKELIKLSGYDRDDDIHTQITDNQKKILEYINVLESITDSYTINDSDIERYITLYKNIFELLKNEAFVYQSTDDDFDGYKVYKKYLTPVNITDNYVLHTKIQVHKDEELIAAKTVLFNETLQINNPDKKIEYAVGFYQYKNKIYVANSLADYKLFANLNDTPISMLAEYEGEFIQDYILPLSEKFEIELPENIPYTFDKIYLEPEKRQVFLEEEDDYLIITPQVAYDYEIGTKLIEFQHIYKLKEQIITKYHRNFEYEKEFLNFLSGLHPDFDEQKTEGIFYIHIDDMTKDLWFYHFFDQLKKENIEIYGLKNLKKFKYSPYKAKIQTGITSGIDWFDVNIEVSFGNQQISLKDLKKAIVNKEKFIKLNDNSIGILPEEWLEKMLGYFKHGTIEKDTLKISKLKFSIIDKLFEDIDQEEILEEIYAKKQQLKQFDKIHKVRVPKEITAELRNYQKEGLNWLHFLNKMKWGGILADDMGLGKTLQVIALLQAVVKKTKTPNLIVVPTSLLFNWKNELEKFAPKLKFAFYYGADREKTTKIFKQNDLVVTTYGMLTRDIEFLTKQSFNYVILDESQAIKNPNSLRYKAALLLKAKNRLTLTGTPIENSTFDLFAQMNFVNPGFFGSVKDFKTNYAIPIDKNGEKDAANELQTLISPFVLRRTKEQVAKELPPKVEDVLYCELLPEQQKIYDAYKNDFRNLILNKIETDGLNKSKMYVLAALTKLRQICDAPYLLKDKHINTKQSAKIKLLLEHINEKTAHHKILIFSQFTSMLALIKEELDKQNFLYEYLDGKSSHKKREESVNNFQTNNNIRVFLISLKAGGTGLNLTAADYVYIVDPWWNPAVENQAIDRVYRIGQDKNVMAYRIIAKNTIEEKILELQSKKKQLASDIIQTDENIMKTIDKKTLLDLFS